MKKTFTVIALVLLAVSCNRYLDIKPYGQTIPETAEEFSALLHAHLDEIDYGEEVVMGDGLEMADLECYADNLAANLTQYPGGNYISLYIGEQLSAKQTLYTNLYAVIRDCNIIIGYLEDRSSRLGMDVLGTAYALRRLAIRIIRGLVYRWLQNLIWRRSLLAVLITRPSNGSKRI